MKQLKENKSTIKLIAAIIIIMFVFKVLSKEPEIANIEIETEPETEIATETEKETIDEFAEYRAKKVELSAGYHKIGIPTGGSINSGTYRVYAKKGYGLITGDLWQGYISETVGYSNFTRVTERIERLFLTSGDSFKIEGDCVLVFDPIE